MKKLVSLLLAMGLLVGCTTTSEPVVKEVADNPEFEQWCTDVFVKEMNSNYILQRELVRNAEGYELVKPEVKWDVVSLDYYQEYADTLKGYLEALNNFDASTLSKRQVALQENLILNLDCRIYFYEHPEFKDTFWGDNSVLTTVITTLKDFVVDSTEDLDEYMTLVGDTDRYFYEVYMLLQYQQENGFGLNDIQMDEAKAELNEFLMSEENQLTTIFEKKLKQFDVLPEEDANNYREYHQSILDNELLPVIQDIVANMDSLKRGDNNRLIDYENGKEYFEVLARYQTSTNYSLDEIYSFMASYLQSEIQTIRDFGSKKPEAFEAYSNYPLGVRSRLEIMNLDLNNMSKYVPSVEGVDFGTLLSEEGEIGPMYRIPSIDRRDTNALDTSNEDPAYLYASLAHEAFPGHIYLSLYTSQLDLNPLYYWLNMNGYVEGWASYAQLYAYKWEGMDEDIAMFYRYSTIENYTLAAIIDIGVNYYGYTSEQMTEELNTILGLTMKEKRVKELMDYYGNRPGLYLAYGFGLSQMNNWRNELKGIIGDGEGFDVDIPFNEVILNKGPRTFENIQKDMDEYFHTFDE
ncbi:MAG: DUF885 family protein [Erysipelotrichaceae bacterium]|nr:DUF885 family protein [Erysipelotrichaceae bacterium]